MQGKGFDFSEEEQAKIKKTRKLLEKRFGMENNISDSESEDEDIFAKKEEVKESKYEK